MSGTFFNFLITESSLLPDNAVSDKYSPSASTGYSAAPTSLIAAYKSLAASLSAFGVSGVISEYVAEISFISENTSPFSSSALKCFIFS